MEDYTTGTGQKIRVHNEEECKGEYCVIHNPSDHIMKDWPTHWRSDRSLMERICKHGIGHPDPDDLDFKKRMGYDDSQGVHGCDGCCSGSHGSWKVRESVEEETFKKEEFEI
jgi:hypothetical protein